MSALLAMFIAFVCLFLFVALWDILSYVLVEYFWIIILVGVITYFVQYKRGK